MVKVCGSTDGVSLTSCATHAEGKALEEALRLHDALLADRVCAYVPSHLHILTLKRPHGVCSTQ